MQIKMIDSSICVCVLQPAAELEVQAAEVPVQETEGGQRAGPGAQVNKSL